MEKGHTSNRVQTHTPGGYEGGRQNKQEKLDRRGPQRVIGQSHSMDMTTMLSKLEPIYKSLAESAPLYNHTICIEGNIGSGKSTLIKALGEYGYDVHPEPVQQRWGQFLPILYKDPARWGMCFQMEVLDWFHSLKESFNNHAESVEKREKSEGKKKKPAPKGPKNSIWIPKQDLSVIERSPQSAFEIFTMNLHDCGLLTDWEKSLLLRFYHLTRWRPAKIFYLRTPPEVCCARIKERSRKGEDGVDMALIEQLHRKHEDLYLHQENVVIIDGKAERTLVLNQILEELGKFTNDK